MIARIARVGLIVALSTLSATGQEPEEARIKAIVATLAAPEFEGRRGAGGRKAAEYLVDQFRALTLEPLFGDDFTQPIPAREPGTVQGTNVGAKLLGADPTLRDEWIIVSAHFDHLGVRDGVLYPGADDNASGVAMMLEVARSLAEAPEKPRRSIMFLGFDLEEIGLFGSRYFVEHMPVPLKQVALFITADMLGRSLGGVCEPYVFVMGSEHAPGLRPWIERAAVDRPVTVGWLGADLLVLPRSDYGPFRVKKVPFLFFSTGENPCYHSPKDVPETLNHAQVAAISRIILGVVKAAAAAESVPKWEPVADLPLAEAVTLRDVMRRLQENRATLKIGQLQTNLMTNALRDLDGIIERGTITKSERAGVIQVARIILFSVF